MSDYELIKKALAIAREAHRGQFDKSGVDYIFHPITVALLCDTAKEKAVALLHDTLEDCPDKVSYDMIAENVGKDIADAVEILTNNKDKFSSYLEYVHYVKNSGNKLAISVKKADLTMNMDITRSKNPTEEDYLRNEKKYKPAWDIINS